MEINDAERILYAKTPMGDIYTITWTPEYVEFVGDVDGTVATYRIYNNGDVHAE